MLGYWIVWAASAAAAANCAVAIRQKNWHSAWGWGIATSCLIVSNLNLI
jgi:hypothetical protein